MCTETDSSINRDPVVVIIHRMNESKVNNKETLVEEKVKWRRRRDGADGVDCKAGRTEQNQAKKEKKKKKTVSTEERS